MLIELTQDKLRVTYKRLQTHFPSAYQAIVKPFNVRCRRELRPAQSVKTSQLFRGGKIAGQRRRLNRRAARLKPEAIRLIVEQRYNRLVHLAMVIIEPGLLGFVEQAGIQGAGVYGTQG